MSDRRLSEEQRLMRQSCRDFVDEVVIPFIRGNWQREWSMVPEERLPPEILQGADKVGIRTLGVPEEFGGVELDKASEVATFALIAEEIARGDSGLGETNLRPESQHRIRRAEETGFPAQVGKGFDAGSLACKNDCGFRTACGRGSGWNSAHQRLNVRVLCFRAQVIPRVHLHEIHVPVYQIRDRLRLVFVKP